MLHHSKGHLPTITGQPRATEIIEVDTAGTLTERLLDLIDRHALSETVAAHMLELFKLLHPAELRTAEAIENTLKEDNDWALAEAGVELSPAEPFPETAAAFRRLREDEGYTDMLVVDAILRQEGPIFEQLVRLIP